MISCYVTGILPRPKELIEVTRAYDRRQASEKQLEKAFEDATLKVIDSQISAKLGYVTDGMLRWQDLLRPFAESLYGVKTGSLTRWFNNNMFYRKPIIIGDLQRKKSIVKEIAYIKCLPSDLPWKIVLPAPYTFVQLSENRFYKNKECMFEYAEILRKEIRDLSELGFKYVQLSDPALVYQPSVLPISRDELAIANEALRVAVGGTLIKTCLQTYFGDFSQILPEALDFPVDHLGIDLYETDFEKLKEYSFEKGVALGLVNSRSSLVEDVDDLVRIARKIINSLNRSCLREVFICPNCDLEFLPWKKAEEKMKVASSAAEILQREFYG